MSIHPRAEETIREGGVLASRDWAGEVGPHIPGRARRVGEARVGLQPLLRLRRNAAEDDVQSPEAHVNRLADRDARQASTEVALYTRGVEDTDGKNDKSCKTRVYNHPPYQFPRFFSWCIF